MVLSANLNDIGAVLGEIFISEQRVQDRAKNASLWSSCGHVQDGEDAKIGGCHLGPVLQKINVQSYILVLGYAYFIISEK